MVTNSESEYEEEFWIYYTFVFGFDVKKKNVIE